MRNLVNSLEETSAALHSLLAAFLSLQTPIVYPYGSVEELTLPDLQEEMSFVASYFLLAPEYKEPIKMLSRHPSERRIINGFQIQPWLSKEDYLCVFTHTTFGRNFVFKLLGLLQ